MKKINIVLIAIVMSSCANYNFIKTGMDETKFSAKSEDCPVTILRSLPTDRKYVEIGLCKGTAPGGGIVSDKTYKAIEQIKKCACVNGGNAILLEKDNEAGYLTGFGYSQQVAKASGMVYFIYPKE